MALPEDFSKIFGSTATGGLTPIGDVNYAKGWEFVGSNPPTKNDFSYLQNLSDLKSQWLYSNKLQRTDPFGDIKSDGAAAISTALTNLGLKEAAKRAVGTGAGQIPDMSAFEYVGNASAGYLKLPNGFKLQWLETGKVPSGTTGVGYWAYPLSVCLFAIAVPVAVTPNTTAGNVVAGAFSNAAVELHNWGQISASARIIGIGR